eukprot:snap_masked-scaffold_65-processed-gene-0.5-mRNA-1 protein AED:0.01 eAED:0.01 QI:80/1/1/1/0.33/0/4/88/494
MDETKKVKEDKVSLEAFNQSLIIKKCTSTIESLEKIWEYMGLDKQEQNTQLSLVQEELFKVLENKINSELSVQEEYELLIPKIQEEINGLSKQLEIDNDIRIPKEYNSLMPKITYLVDKRDQLIQIKINLETSLSPLLEKLNLVYKQLKRNIPEIINSSKITQPRIVALEELYEQVDQERNFKYNRYKNIVSTLKDLVFEVVDGVEFSLDKVNKEYDQLDLSDEFLEELESDLKSLREEKDKRVEKLKDLGGEIQKLWDLLEVEDEYRQSFFDKNGGLGLQVIKNCEEELQNLITLKKEQMKKLVVKKTEEIEEMWKLMGYMEEDKEKFDIEEEEEKVFEVLDGYLEELEERWSLLEPIFGRLNKYKELCKEREEYEELVKDSGRLLDRKRGMKQLREEEKQRKRVEKLLPALVEKLKGEIKDFEKEYGVLKVDGVEKLKEVVENEKKFAEYKVRMKEEKRIQRMTSGSKTPNKPRIPKQWGSTRKNKENVYVN